jgi:hypothetical protein
MASSTEVQDRDTGDSDPAYTKLKTKELPWYFEDIEGALSAEVSSNLTLSTSP